MKNIIFDIETGGLPKDEILHLLPNFEAPSNYKDAEKISAYKLKKQEEWLETKTALSAISGKVLAIGYLIDNEPIEVIGYDSEKETLEAFWNLLREHSSARVIGFNSHIFDIAFLVRRSWKNGVIVPNIYNGRFLHSRFVDLLQVWACGSLDKVSLDNLAKFFGVGAKTGNGKMFSVMWEVNRDSAIEYLKNDVAMTKAVALAMGVIDEEGDLF